MLRRSVHHLLLVLGKAPSGMLYDMLSKKKINPVSQSGISKEV
jgi:hypothetical protein